MKIGALVPARIGSKRLPKKNIKVLGDKPLICWTIDVLLEADIFSDITVSTESEEVMDVVRQYYSELEVKILKRPEELAQDDSPMRDVIFHYLENRPELDWYGVFLPTFPFRKKEKILEAYEAILSRYPWKVNSVTEKKYCLLDFFYPVKEGVKRFFRMPPLYCGYVVSVYEFGNVNYPFQLWYRYGLTNYERTYSLTASFKETIDIDTEEDFKLALSFLKKETKGIQILKEVQLNENWIFICPKNFDKIDNVISNFNEKLKDTSLPLLVLKENKIPVFYLKFLDGYARSYIASSEACSKFINDNVLRTQNTKYFSSQYFHSPIFRFLRIKSKPQEDLDLFPQNDTLGILYKAGHGSKDAIIPWNRVIWERELINLY